MSDPDTARGSAVSRDGRTFAFSRDGGNLHLVPGDVVVLGTPDGDRFLGQILEHAVTPGQQSRIEGTGALIGALGTDDAPRRADCRPFSSATIEPASLAQLEALQRASDPRLTVGTWPSCGVEVAARLRAQGFGRHTFLCGQSGSGKTYALGVILEQLLLGTDLRMVVLDPNADFVRLGQPRPDAPPEAGQRLASLGIRVLGAASTTGEPLRMRFATMPTQAQAAVLQLDPLVDRGEYNHFLPLMADSGPQDVDRVVALMRQGGPDGEALAQRIENLGMP